MNIDMEKIRRESIRWIILLTLKNARPTGFYANSILAVVQAEYPDASLKEVVTELSYLHSRDLVFLKKQPDGRYHASLTRYGVDIAEYTVDCEPGIARPEKYW